MLKTRISRLQWWLLIALFTTTFVAYPRVHDAAWWWSVLFIVAFYFAILAILRLDIETPRQARYRKQANQFWEEMRTMPTTIALPYPPDPQHRTNANPGSLWYVQDGDEHPTEVWEQRGTRDKPNWQPLSRERNHR